MKKQHVFGVATVGLFSIILFIFLADLLVIPLTYGTSYYVSSSVMGFTSTSYKTIISYDFYVLSSETFNETLIVNVELFLLFLRSILAPIILIPASCVCLVIAITLFLLSIKLDGKIASVVIYVLNLIILVVMSLLLFAFLSIKIYLSILSIVNVSKDVYEGTDLKGNKIDNFDLRVKTFYCLPNAIRIMALSSLYLFPIIPFLAMTGSLIFSLLPKKEKKNPELQPAV